MKCRFFNVVSVDVFLLRNLFVSPRQDLFSKRQTNVPPNMSCVCAPTEVHVGLSGVHIEHDFCFCISAYIDAYSTAHQRILFYGLHILKVYILSRILLNHFLASTVVVSVMRNGVVMSCLGASA